MNEGHVTSPWSCIRVRLDGSPLTFDEARQKIMATNVFTTAHARPGGHRYRSIRN